MLENGVARFKECERRDGDEAGISQETFRYDKTKSSMQMSLLSS
jgi:hypothetical protein